MSNVKTRIFALLLIIVSIALIHYNWRQLWQEHEYSMKLAAFAPLCLVGGIFLLLFPTKVGKPNTAKEKLVVFAVFAIGLLAGLVNWYLMDPGFFGR